MSGPPTVEEPPDVQRETEGEFRSLRVAIGRLRRRIQEQADVVQETGESSEPVFQSLLGWARGFW